MEGSLRIVYSFPASVEGGIDTADVLIERDGKVTVRRSSSGPVDEFAAPPEGYSFSADPDRACSLLDTLSLDEGTGLDNGHGVTVIYGDRTEMYGTEPDPIREIRYSLLSLVDISGESETFIPSYTEDELDRLCSAGTITKDIHDSLVGRMHETDKRRAEVERMIDSRTYLRCVSSDDISKDHSLGLISDEQYSMFVWNRRNIADTDPKENDMISVKLKLSMWGLRIGGRFDTFEFIVDKDDKHMTDRSYCVHGTLFEGCGNYKAPDAARRTLLSDERIGMIFNYLQSMEDVGILGKNLSEPLYDCGFFDLYVRYEERDSVHTKGTTPYPYFIRYLMYLMGAEESL